MNKRLIRLFLALTVASAMLISCKKREEPAPPVSNIIQITKSFEWYAFTSDNFIPINKIQNAPTAIAKPWTECTRVTSMALSAPADESCPKGYALVNRLGVIEFDGRRTNLYADVAMFRGRTASAITLYNNTPVFSLYRSTFFNADINKRPFLSSTHQADVSISDGGNGDDPFLVQFDTVGHISFPIVAVHNIDLEELFALNALGAGKAVNSHAEITDHIYCDGVFKCTAKLLSEDEERVAFSYFSLKPKVDLLTITPQTAQDLLTVTPIAQSDYREAARYADFNTAPERVRELLKDFPSTTSFSLELHGAGSPILKRYTQGSSSALTSFSATALMSDTFAIALFLDGTIFFKGALWGGHFLNSGRTVAMRLPKLPAGFVYSSLVISGGTLYAGWEENHFYKCAKSGFIAVHLDELFD